MENGWDGKERGDFTDMFMGWGGEGAVPHGLTNWNLHSDCVTSVPFFGNLLLLMLFFSYLLYARESSKYVHL